MFTNLDFLSVGKKWIPDNATFKERQKNYVEGRQLYDGKFIEVFKEVWTKMASRYGKNWDDIEQVLVNLNLFRTLTETFKILAFSKEPSISLKKGEDSTKTEKLDKRTTKLFLDTMKQAFISAHAQGDGVFKVYTDSAGKIGISSVNPELWVPVYNPHNLAEITCHVVGSVYEVDNEVGTWYGGTRVMVDKYLDIEIHYKGYYEKVLFKLDYFNVIEKEISRDEHKIEGWADFCVFPFNYGTPNWRTFGHSQYADVIPLVDEAVTRISNRSKVLDDHSEPQLVVADENLEHDSNSGEYIYKRKQTLKLGQKGFIPQYITWDGNMAAVKDQIETVMNMFYMVSGTNAQMYGQDIAGNLSGDALAKILLIPIAKVKEMVIALEDAAEQALKCALFLESNTAEVEIEFEIGVFNKLEDISKRLQGEMNAGITSVERAVEELNPRYSEDELQTEVERIKAQAAAGAVPNITDLTDPNTGEPL